jgi:hypothetical protein
MDFRTNTVKPILLMVFNRPDTTERVWEQIRKAKPRKLYISADGPRINRPDDIPKCLLVRKIVSNIDWECDVKTLFHENNLGCTLAGKTAFDWVFSMETEMIQMEDDVLPTQSFFWFMQEMLERYKDDKRIGIICSENFGITHGSETYFFTQFGSSGGWAMYKRIYDLWEYKLDSLEETVNTPEFKSTFVSDFQYKFWKRNFFIWKYKGGNTYDLQTLYLVHKYNLLNIVPNINLNTNIGWEGEAKDRDSISEYDINKTKFGNIPSYEIEEIVHPKDVISADKEIGEKWFKYHFQGDMPKYKHRILWFLSSLFSSSAFDRIKIYFQPIYTKIFKF